MWNFLKFNLLAIGGSILVLLCLILLLFLTSTPDEEPNTVVLFLLGTVGSVAMLVIFSASIGTVADVWRVFVQGEEVEGFKWQFKPKSHPKQEIRSEPSR